jgi:hypothetical protein
VSSHSTEFFLAVDLWLTWLLPSQSLKKAGLQQSVVERSQLWREQLLRTYVASNFHFYSTLLILFLRKMRDTLNQGWGRQELTLRLLKRVLTAFLIPEVRSAIAEVSRMADFMWAHNNACMRGYELLHAHVKRLRLDRSRPCLLANSQHEAIFLKAELLSLGGRASTGAEDDEDILAKLQKYAALQVAWISQYWNRERTDPPAGEWQEDRNTLALEVRQGPQPATGLVGCGILSMADSEHALGLFDLGCNRSRGSSQTWRMCFLRRGRRGGDRGRPIQPPMRRMQTGMDCS